MHFLEKHIQRSDPTLSRAAGFFRDSWEICLFIYMSLKGLELSFKFSGFFFFKENFEKL